MTIKVPTPNIYDRILKFFGKKRGVIIPTDFYKKFGQYVYAKAKRENFWKALLRPKGQNLPEGVVDIYSLYDQQLNHSKKSSDVNK